MVQNIKKKVYFGLRRLGRLFNGTFVARNFLFRRIYNYALRVFHSQTEDLVVFEKNGIKIYVDQGDPRHYSCLSRGLPLEGLENELFSEYIKNGMTVVDVGANIGYYTLLAAKLVGPSGKVYAFEPEPKNFSILSKNISINNFRNVVVLPKAASDKNDKAFLYLSETNNEGHRIYNLGEGRKKIEIESVSLDDFFVGQEEKIDFIKIDVEGAEMAVLEGMRHILKCNRNIKIIIEFKPFILKKSHFDPNEFLKILLNVGFKIYLIADKILGPYQDARVILEDVEKLRILNLFCEK